MKMFWNLSEIDGRILGELWTMEVKRKNINCGRNVQDFYKNYGKLETHVKIVDKLQDRTGE